MAKIECKFYYISSILLGVLDLYMHYISFDLDINRTGYVHYYPRFTNEKKLKSSIIHLVNVRKNFDHGLASWNMQYSP